MGAEAAGEAENRSASSRRQQRPADSRPRKPTSLSTAVRLRVWASIREAIDTTLYSAFGQRQVSTMYTGINQYHVVLEVLPEFQQNPASLNSIYVRTNNGTPVPFQPSLICVPCLRHSPSTTKGSFHPSRFRSLSRPE